MENILFKFIFVLLLETTFIGVLSTGIMKSIKSADGGIIDCVDVYKQPAFDHPALKDHKIQMSPSYDPRKRVSSTAKGDGESTTVTVTSQLWQKSGRCPKGTVPIRRGKGKKLPNNENQIFHMRKRPIHHVVHNETQGLHQANHSMAILLAAGYSYSGAKGDIKVWNPYVESDDEYSTSQVSLKNGPANAYEAIEAGWAVNPGVYGDKQTRLFVYWTVDGSNNTGCFDATCPGFVQVDNEIALGAAIYPISKVGGLPYQISVHIFKDPVTSNWWVNYGGKSNIGYWPPDLFTLLSYQATMVQWGGEVYSTRVGTTPHTATAMGSGRFPDFIFGSSGWVKGIRVEQNSHELIFPEWVSPYTDEYNCYDIFYLSDYVYDPEFYYGGPGRSYRCP